MRTLWWIPLLAWVLSSCGGSGTADGSLGQASADPFAPTTGLPSGIGGDAQKVGPDGIPDNLRGDAGVVLNPDEIVYTDPDAENPEALPELRQLLSEVPQDGPWTNSHSKAFREARRSDKPVLIWFTDSQNSPNCKALSQELLGKSDFDEWAEKAFVRLEVDRQIKGSKLDDDASRKSNYVKDLKKRYKVIGQPTLLVLTPSGEVIGRYRGYKRGQSEYKWGQLRQGAMLAGEAHEKWKKKMEKKGYRTWKDPRGRKIFAKLLRYHEGNLLLMEPDGTRFKTKTKHLSPNDQDWVEEQKNLSEQRRAARAR